MVVGFYYEEYDMTGGGGKKDYSNDAFMNAFNAAQQGQSRDTVLGNSAGYENIAQMGFDMGAPQQSSGSGFHAPSMPHQPSGPSYADQMKAQQDEYVKQLEEQRMAQGRRDRDSLFSGYMDAAGSAADYVNAEITKEQSNARLLGIDYAIDDAQKTARINDYFSTIWGEGEQTQLEAMMSEFGNPTGFTEFSVIRGDGGAYAGAQGEETSKAASKGVKPNVVSDEEEDPLGGSASILGV